MESDDALIATLRDDRAAQRRLTGARRLTLMVGTAFGMAMLIAAGLRSREVADATNFLSFPAYGSKKGGALSTKLTCSREKRKHRSSFQELSCLW